MKIGKYLSDSDSLCVCVYVHGLYAAFPVANPFLKTYEVNFFL